jgi:hypothetical protein
MEYVVEMGSGATMYIHRHVHPISLLALCSRYGRQAEKCIWKIHVTRTELKIFPSVCASLQSIN